jgi:hypothetical protein
VFGLALIVLGDLLVGGASLLHAFEGGQIWKGDLLFMSAAFCWACYSVTARRHGLEAVRANHPDVPIFCASVDRELDERGYIRPGLGDAGDRLYGTD